MNCDGWAQCCFDSTLLVQVASMTKALQKTGSEHSQTQPPKIAVFFATLSPYTLTSF